MNDWKRLATRVERELAVLRAQNDSESLTPQQTDQLRGRIRQCKWFLGLPRLIQEEAKEKQTKDDEAP